MEGSSDEETDRRRPDKIDRLEAQLKALTDMVASLMADRTAQNPAPVQQPAATAQPAQLPQHVQPVPPAQDASQANSNPTVPSNNPVLITVADTQERTHEQDRAKNNVEDSKVASKLESPEEKLRTLQGIDSYGSTSFSDLCFFPDLKLPPKFQTPDFDKYDGSGCPFTHLKVYCGEMCLYGDNEPLLIQQFQKSLTGPALRWFVELDRSKIHSWTDLANAFLTQYKFNTEIAPDRIDLQRMQKRNNESFRAYAQRWRELAAQVKPSMTEREMIGTFINTLREPYLSHLVGHTKSSFADLVIVGDRVEDALKSGRLMDVQALQSLLEQPGAGTSHKRVTAKKQDPGSKEVQMIEA